MSSHAIGTHVLYLVEPWIRLDLSPNTDLPRKHGKRIRAVGGTFSEVRGSQVRRCVRLPLKEPLELASGDDAPLSLAAELVDRYPGHEKGATTTAYLSGMGRDVQLRIRRDAVLADLRGGVSSFLQAQAAEKDACLWKATVDACAQEHAKTMWSRKEIERVYQRHGSAFVRWVLAVLEKESQS